MKIRMISTQKGARDGEIYPETFLKDSEYNITGELLQVFLRNGWALQVTEVEKPITDPVEEKAPQEEPKAEEVSATDPVDPPAEEPAETEKTPEVDFSKMTRNELLAFIDTHKLDVNLKQNVDSLRADTESKFKEKVNGN